MVLTLLWWNGGAVVLTSDQGSLPTSAQPLLVVVVKEMLQTFYLV
jgi:hypothetical protein